ncbi:hypothetical protein LB553_10585 [Mesorhizobium sp. CA8]|uniref:PIN-like domain-containing protein n=1 Tax=Mesorhizobium sp. CA8 TaxID=2876637 RepID=UPI001CCFD395|nr:PIN-like domain-containing protein [Mesorhizobium sp. CA8]MBZ9761321.1 hypothetical protein [Mesorhizobium sp. CA8]
MPKQRAEVLAAFKTFGNRLWLPHQAAKEFQNGWRSADSDNRGLYRKLKEDLASKKNEIDDLVRRFTRFDPWPEGSAMDKIDEFFEGLSKDVDAATASLPDIDEVFGAVSDLFDGKVAAEPDQQEIERRVKEAQRRIQGKIPPGYMDKGPGDYLIWAELKEKARTANVPILFVTDDRKEDWWLEQSGKTIGPRPELRQEFLADTGQMFYAYRPGQFLSLVRDRTNNLVSQETVKEMERAELGPNPQVDSRLLLDRAFSIANAADVDPLRVLDLARKLARATDIVNKNSRFANGGGPAMGFLRSEIERWSGEAEQLFFGELAAEDRAHVHATSTIWGQFLQLVDDMSRDNFAAISHLVTTNYDEFWQRFERKRARY